LEKRVSEKHQREFESEALVHLDALLSAASRIVRNRHEAEDVVQETYLRAWKYFGSFVRGSNCRAWLFRIMFNVINGRKGKQAKLAETHLEEDDASEPSRSNIIAFDPIRQIEGHEVLEAATRLPEEYRSALWLVVVEEFSYKEAAEILDVPIGTIMSRLHRARRELRKLLSMDMTRNATG